MGDDEAGGPVWTTRKGVLVLAAATIGIVAVSETLVGTVIPFVEATGVSEVFVGLILILIFSNVVDHLVAITVALKNKMDLSLVVPVGSAAQGGMPRVANRCVDRLCDRPIILGIDV